MAVHWRKEMSVDDSVIDEDHKLLICLVNDFETLINRKLTMVALDRSLTLLKHYAIEHFRREEGLQRAVQYPFYQAHACEHRDLIKKLDVIIAHRRTAESDYNLAVVAREILELLKEWLISHILHTDLRMKHYVARMKPYRQRMATLEDSRGVSQPPPAASDRVVRGSGEPRESGAKAEAASGHFRT